MTDKEKWLDYRNRISMGLGLEGEQTQWVFDKALNAIEQQEHLEYVKERLSYLLCMDYDEDKVFDVIAELLGSIDSD